MKKRGVPETFRAFIVELYTDAPMTFKHPLTYKHLFKINLCECLLGIVWIKEKYAVADRIAEAPVWGYVRRDVMNIIRKRLSALILDEQKFSQNFISRSRIKQR